MRKMSRTMVLAAALGLLIPGAIAFGQPSITNISEAVDTGNSYLVGGLSADGRYVGISRPILWTNGNTYDGPALYDTTTNSYLPHGLKSGNGAVRGVDALADGTPISLVVEVSNANTASYRVGTYPGDSSGYMDGVDSSPGNSNAMGMGTDGNGWMVGTDYNGNNARAWQITNGSVNATAAYNHQRYPGNNILNGVSVSGVAVGNWRDSNGDRAYVVDVTGGATGSGGRALSFADEFASTTSDKGQGNGMSGNGAWAGGYFTVTENSNSLHGWRTLVDTSWTTNGAMEELLPLGFDPLKTQQSNVFDIANDGTAVGYSYDPDTSYQATLWPAGSDQGVLVSDILAGLGVDLSEWQKLERVISISDDGQTVAGRGVLLDGSYSAFVAVIPEPSTISLLVLGGMVLLRRRR